MEPNMASPVSIFRTPEMMRVAQASTIQKISLKLSFALKHFVRSALQKLSALLENVIHIRTRTQQAGPYFRRLFWLLAR
jgi:hypothetical protein